MHIAIVCPPCIYGTGTGPGNTRSAQIPLLIKSVLKRGTGFTVHAGENEWCNVHIKDLGRVYLRLVEAAARGGEGADWDQDGYYFVDAGNMTWGGLTRELVDKCVEKGLLKSTEIQNLEPEEVDKIQPFGSILWGSNSRGHGERARKVLGWKPEEVAVEETLGESVEIEAKDLGML